MLNGTAAILQSIGIVVRRRQQRRRRSRRRRRRLIGLTKLGRAKVAWIAAEAETDSDGGRGREATAPTTPQKIAGGGGTRLRTPVAEANRVESLSEAWRRRRRRTTATRHG